MSFSFNPKSLVYFNVNSFKDIYWVSGTVQKTDEHFHPLELAV